MNSYVLIYIVCVLYNMYVQVLIYEWLFLRRLYLEYLLLRVVYVMHVNFMRLKLKIIKFSNVWDFYKYVWH